MENKKTELIRNTETCYGISIKTGILLTCNSCPIIDPPFPFECIEVFHSIYVLLCKACFELADITYTTIRAYRKY